MERLNDIKKKIIKSFCVVGLDETKLQKYNEEDSKLSFIKDIDILVKKLPIEKNSYINKEKNQKWYRVMENKDVWLRIQFSNTYYEPITDFKIVGCGYDETLKNLLLDKKNVNEKYKPISITQYSSENSENNNDLNFASIPILPEYEPRIKNKDEKFYKIPLEYNAKNIMNLPVKAAGGLLLITRKTELLPLRSLKIQHLKNGEYQFGIGKHKSPYKFKYMAEILEEYPQDDSINKGVAMFCFPQGISIKEEFSMPEWFNFVLTDEAGERTYGSVLIFMEEIRENLFQSFIPNFREEEIVNKERKKKVFLVPKGLCILSRFPFYHNCLLFLKELARIANSSVTKIPLERAICGFVDSLYLQNYNKKIRFSIGDENLDFYRIPNYGSDWDTNNEYLETLIRILSMENIVIAWQGLLIEKKLFLICDSKSVLMQVANALINLIFPFKWIHIFIPILPEKLKVFIESPVPSIMGINFDINLNDLPNDSLILNLNKNCLENYIEKVPKLPVKLNVLLEKKLQKFKEKYQIEEPEINNTNKWMKYQDAVYPSFEIKKYDKEAILELRDIFYDIFIHMFKNYEKYFNWKKEEITEEGMIKLKDTNMNEDEENSSSPIEFKKDIFLKDHNSFDEGSFLYLFCDTSLFSQFENSFSLSQQDGSTMFFFECVKNGRGKNKVFLPEIIPKDKDIIFANKIKIDDLNNKDFFYPVFKLDPKLFINSEVPKKPYRSKFFCSKDEWCYAPKKLKKKDWAKYNLYIIYEIWYTFFSFVLHFYEKEQIIDLMDYALFLLEDLIKKKSISPTRNLFAKMFKVCGRNQLSTYVKKVLFLANKVYKNSRSNNNLFHNVYLNGLYSLTENIGSNNILTVSLGSSIMNETFIKQTITEEISANNIDIESLYNDIIFLTAKFCPYCTKDVNKIQFITIEEILAGFNRDSNKIHTICPNCLAKVDPTFYYLDKKIGTSKVNEFKLMTVGRLKEEIDEICRQFGEMYFYQNFLVNANKFSNIYINIIFYFKIFDLPLFVLYVETDTNKFEKNIKREIIKNASRKKDVKRKETNINLKSGLSLSPEKSPSKYHNLDVSTDHRSGEGTSAVSMKSNNSEISPLELEIWKNLIIKQQKIEKLTGDKIGTEDRSDMNNRIKDMKSVLSNIVSFFVKYYKEKLDAFLYNRDIDEESKLSKLSNLNYINNNDNLTFDDDSAIDRKDNTETSINISDQTKSDYRSTYEKNHSGLDEIARSNSERPKDAKKINPQNNPEKNKEVVAPIQENVNKGFGDSIKKMFSVGGGGKKKIKVYEGLKDDQENSEK